MAKSKPKAAKGARVPGVRKPADPVVIAVLISDCHFSICKPKARAGTHDQWMATQEAHLREAMKSAESHDATLVIAGDIFDTWNEPVELVTMIASAMSDYQCPVYMIPGQHDLPYHELHEIDRAAIFNLCMAARGMRKRTDVYLVGGAMPLHDSGWWIYGAGWGQPFDYQTAMSAVRLEDAAEDKNILLCAHKYIYSGQSTAHPGAKKEDCSHALPMRDALAGYTACVFGDNHIPFQDDIVYNHGAFIRRKSDERKIHPELGLLHGDGHIERSPMRAPGSDLWHDGEEEYIPFQNESVCGELMGEFAESVKALAADETVDFRAACNRLLGTSKLSTAAKREILSLLDE